MPCILYRKENVRSGLIHPNGKIIALLVSSNVYTIELYRIDDPGKPIKLLWSYQIRDRPSCMDWCNNARSICIGDARGSITIIDVNGHVNSYNSLHSPNSEIKEVRSFMLGGEVINLRKEGVFLRKLKELMEIEPYSLSIRNAGFSEMVDLDELLSDFNLDREGTDALADSPWLGGFAGELEGSRNKREPSPEEHQSASKSNLKEAPRLLPEFLNLDEEVCLILTVDSKNNMICSIGGHTPVWVYNLHDLGQGIGRSLRSVDVCGSYIVVTYCPESGGEDLFIEMIDMRRFFESFGLLFNTFGFLQYMRQLLNYLKGVFEQILSVWFTGIKPFRQLLSNDKTIRKSNFSIFLLSIVTGAPVNMFKTRSFSPAELSITIDQLVMIGQNINDSMVYIENTISQTVDPAIQQIVVIWNIIQRTEVIEDQETDRVTAQIQTIKEFNENLSSEIEPVKPIVHTFLHLLSIAKTYRDDVRKVSPDNFAPPKIISSVNSNIIASTFNLNTDSYYTLKDFVERKRIYTDENVRGMHDQTEESRFFNELEFRRIDKLLNKDTEGCSLSCVLSLGSAIDEIYKLAVNKVSRNFISSLSSLKVKLDPEFFSSQKISNSVSVSSDDFQNIIVKLIHPIQAQDNKYLISKISVKGDEFSCHASSHYDSGTVLQDPTDFPSDAGRIEIEYSSRTFSPCGSKVSLSCSAICLPVQLQGYKISSVVWTQANELLTLMDNGLKSSLLFGFNLDLVKFQSLVPVRDEGPKSSLASSLVQNSSSLSFNVLVAKDTQDASRHPGLSSLNAVSLSNVFHYSQDISRIHRPQKFRNLSVNTSGTKDCGSLAECSDSQKESHANAEILDFHSQLSQVSPLVATTSHPSVFNSHPCSEILCHFRQQCWKDCCGMSGIAASL